MKVRFLRLGEIICVALLAVFIVFVSSSDKLSTVPFDEVSASVMAECNLKGLIKRDKLELKGKFSLNSDEFTDFIYYSSNSVMDVRELLIVSCKEKQLLTDAEKKIKAYVEEKANLFEGYAPNESKLINSHVLESKKGYLIFYIGEETEKAASAFSQSL